MRILLLVHAFNSLAQRLYCELARLGHEVSVEFDISEAITLEAAARYCPHLVLAPFLKRAIPETIWRSVLSIVIHPGIPGDRGPSALDWAMAEGRQEWGVTALQANGQWDAGDIWASVPFTLREGTKGSLYRREVADCAWEAVQQVLARMRDPYFRPLPQDDRDPGMKGRVHPPMRQCDRVIDWASDGSLAILRKIRAADGSPGVLDRIDGQEVYLYDAHPEDVVRGRRPGELLARRHGAILRATRDGAVWIGHLQEKHPDGRGPKLPATCVLGTIAARLPELAVPLASPDGPRTYRDIRYREKARVGYLRFDFYNGAMSADQCLRLLEAFRHAQRRDTRIIVLEGGADFWSNGIHLHEIEAAESPADESWRNVEAMNDLVRAIIECDTHLTVAALRGNAAAGGVCLALAADYVFARAGIVLNPHYRGMGNLHGSEYWTYLLPKRVGHARAQALADSRLPLAALRAAELGLIDGCWAGEPAGFPAGVEAWASRLAVRTDYADRLAFKRRQRQEDEARKPLAQHRAEEMAQMALNFYGFDPSYHVARYNFVHRVPYSRTPVHLARHRARGCPTDGQDRP
ncbi:MAG: hydrogenase maturation protein [Betaproteobacteria bacterium]|nr:hydrogenase maturation protein [Betaproteobacteria bacterium]